MRAASRRRILAVTCMILMLAFSAQLLALEQGIPLSKQLELEMAEAQRKKCGPICAYVVCRLLGVAQVSVEELSALSGWSENGIRLPRNWTRA